MTRIHFIGKLPSASAAISNRQEPSKGLHQCGGEIHKSLRVWDRVDHFIKKKNLKYAQKSSIFIRLLDGQRENMLDKRLDIETLDFSYLPDDKRKIYDFAFNQQVKEKLESKSKLKKVD